MSQGFKLTNLLSKTTQQTSKTSQEKKENEKQWKIKSSENKGLKQTKKSEGWLSFINQKLNQWPLWVKMTSNLKSEPQKDLKTTVNEQPELYKWRKRNIKVKILPWDLFFERCWSKTKYQYYHCKEDNLTYFFQTPNSEQNAADLHHQIFEPPKQAWNITCSMPTSEAIPMIQEYFKKRQQEKAKYGY